VRDRPAEVLGLPVAPWHFDVVAARDGNAGRLAAWDELLESVGRPGHGSGEPARVAAERAATALVVADLDEDRVRELLGRGKPRGSDGVSLERDHGGP
jgi:hypothetical protein